MMNGQALAGCAAEEPEISFLTEASLFQGIKIKHPIKEVMLCFPAFGQESKQQQLALLQLLTVTHLALLS